MLQMLRIKNLALIREEEIEFGEGLNILTGETGAGKSVVIGSVNLALGAKADADMIRTGETSALVELTFLLDEAQEEQVRAMDFVPEEDHTLLITRKLSQGRSISRVNGETVTLSRLRALSELLISIHGQNDHTALMRASKQKQLLDDYCGERLAEALATQRKLYGEYQDVLQTLSETSMDAASRAREADLLHYEIDEIEGAHLREGEEEQLDQEYRRMANARKIGEALSRASAVLAGNAAAGGDNLSDALGYARRELAQVAEVDEAIEGIVRQIDDMDGLLQDLLHALSAAEEELVYDERDFCRVTERLDFLHRLQNKYGDSAEQILREQEKRAERLDFLENLETKREEAARKQEKLTEMMREQCAKITGIRQQGAAELAERIRASLVDCNFLDVRFLIAVETSDREIAADGWDSVRFDIQTNPGEAMRPLSAIASGGELSRIMLGIKTVLADRNDTPTMIFDEIDAGISGRTAWRVSEKLGALSGRHQILCITHLPQIAAMADTHFLIEKHVEEERTLTQIVPLNEQESVRELARLLSAEEVTDEVLGNASQLKERAKAEKAGKTATKGFPIGKKG